MPEASPSAFTTIGKLHLFIKSFASINFLKIPNFAVGILYFSHNFLVKIFEPSSFEANLFGPKVLILFFSKLSTIPSTSGFSGPIITISISFFFTKFIISSKLLTSIEIFFAIRFVPAFPGIQKILLITSL